MIKYNYGAALWAAHGQRCAILIDGAFPTLARFCGGPSVTGLFLPALIFLRTLRKESPGKDTSPIGPDSGWDGIRHPDSSGYGGNCRNPSVNRPHPGHRQLFVWAFRNRSKNTDPLGKAKVYIPERLYNAC